MKKSKLKKLLVESDCVVEAFKWNCLPVEVQAELEQKYIEPVYNMLKNNGKSNRVDDKNRHSELAAQNLAGGKRT